MKSDSDIRLVHALISHVEQVSKRHMKTPRDFEWLSSDIQKKRGESLSVNTLKRIWGYLHSTSQPRDYTLDCLARYLGYSDFAHFTAHEQGLAGEESSSEAVITKKLNVSQDLAVRDRLLLTWSPGRSCTIRHLGNEQFVVEESDRTRLLPGNTFRCGLIIEGEPLYLDDLVQKGSSPVVYVCGKTNGIHFEVIKANSDNSHE